MFLKRQYQERLKSAEIAFLTSFFRLGIGLAYQNGMTFYNTAAAAPTTSIAPPTDPGTIYQATGVFGKHHIAILQSESCYDKTQGILRIFVYRYI